MTKIYLFLFFNFLFISGSFAQSGSDSSRLNKDSVKKDSIKVSAKPVAQQATDSTRILHPDSAGLRKDSPGKKNADTATTQIAGPPPDILLFAIALRENGWFNFLGKPRVALMQEHKADTRDGLFYLLLGVVFYFGLIRVVFPKYFDNLISLFVRASLRQQQIREQLLQTPLPSLLLNILFVLTTGLYVCTLMRYYQRAPGSNFILLCIDCCVLIGGLYAFKFMLLKISGWIFNIPRVTDTYIFIVFLVNKILGIFLIPFIIVISFSTPAAREIAVTASFCLVIFLFLYRFIASYPSVRNEIKISILYFFLYLCAFEIAPLLLIYKVLLTYLEKAS